MIINFICMCNNFRAMQLKVLYIKIVLQKCDKTIDQMLKLELILKEIELV